MITKFTTAGVSDVKVESGLAKSRQVGMAGLARGECIVQD